MEEFVLHLRVSVSVMLCGMTAPPVLSSIPQTPSKVPIAPACSKKQQLLVKVKLGYTPNFTFLGLLEVS